MRWAVALLLSIGCACAQVPDVRFRVDLTVAYNTEQAGPTSLRLYDTLGRTSTVGITLFLEPGLRAYASERLQHIPGDPDKSLLDEYYVEDQGIWRLGKQYLPFGSERILRESVLAARADTNLVFENLPLSAAVCSAGSGAQQGVVARLGGRVAVSGAIGDHFGIAATALDLIRRPEDSPGLGRGWKRALGADGSKRSGIFTTRAEFVWLVEGETPMDGNLSVFDLSVSADPDKNHSVTLGWTRQEPDQVDFYRLLGSVAFMKNGFFEPMVRYRNGRLYDITLALRFRL